MQYHCSAIQCHCNAIPSNIMQYHCNTRQYQCNTNPIPMQYCTLQCTAVWWQSSLVLAANSLVSNKMPFLKKSNQIGHKRDINRIISVKDDNPSVLIRIKYSRTAGLKAGDGAMQKLLPSPSCWWKCAFEIFVPIVGEFMSRDESSLWQIGKINQTKSMHPHLWRCNQLKYTQL